MTADFLHIGHIKFLETCADQCDKLFVGIMTDECVEGYKKHTPLMNQYDRAELIQSITCVKNTMFQRTFEFPHHIMRLKVFYEDDFLIFDTEEHRRKGADVLIPVTPNISSTMKRKLLSEF